MTTLAPVLDQHAISGFSPDSTLCRCDHRWRTHAEYRVHLEEALTAVLPEVPATETGDPMPVHVVDGRLVPVDVWSEGAQS